jgi:hypothetical protein
LHAIAPTPLSHEYEPSIKTAAGTVMTALSVRSCTALAKSGQIPAGHAKPAIFDN